MGKTSGIGVNPRGYQGTCWYMLPGVIASRALGGPIPNVLRAIRLEPISLQDGLRSVQFRGGPVVILRIPKRTRSWLWSRGVDALGRTSRAARGARAAAHAGPSEAFVSQTVKDLVAGSGSLRSLPGPSGAREGCPNSRLALWSDDQ